jgi:hypothetical protein
MLFSDMVFAGVDLLFGVLFIVAFFKTPVLIDRT